MHCDLTFVVFLPHEKWAIWSVNKKAPHCCETFVVGTELRSFQRDLGIITELF